MTVNTLDNITIASQVPSQLDAILEVATDVLRDYGDTCHNQRIVQMAQFLVANFGGEPYNVDHSKRGIPRIALETGSVHVIGDQVAYLPQGEVAYKKLSTKDTRALVVGLLRGCELAEG